MILSLDFINKLDNTNIFNINKSSLTKAKLDELLDIRSFIEKYFSLFSIAIKNISCFIELFKYEHDCLLFFRKKNKIIIINLEVKKNSTPSVIDEQIKSHLDFLARRLNKNTYKLYGLSYIKKIKYLSICEVKNLNNKGFRIFKKRKSLSFVLNKIIEEKFIYIEDPSIIIKSMEGDINQIIDVCKEKKISLTSGEKNITDWIKEKLSSKDLIIINANAGSGKTTILLNLFFEEYGKYCVLFNNNRIQKLISENNLCYEKNEYFFYKSDNCINKNIEILLVDEAQRLNIKQINNLLLRFKKIIFFGDEYQVFDRKYDCNYGKELYQTLLIRHSCSYKKYNSDTNRRFCRNFPTVIKHILNHDKYQLSNKISDTINSNESIFMYDEIDSFLNSYSLIEGNKKMFSELKFNSEIYKTESFYKNGFSALYGMNNPSFSFDNNFEEIGTVYNAFSFEIDYVFLIIKSDPKTIKSNKYIFNEIYTLATRIRKELHILFMNKNIEYFYKELSIITRVN